MRLDRLPSVPLPGGGVRVVVAAGVRSRLLGLAWLGAAVVPPDCALLLIPCGSVHTVGMRFALDLIWLSRAGRVVRVDRDVGPWRLRACRGARAVIEVRAGSAEAVVTALVAEGDAVSAGLARARLRGRRRRRGARDPGRGGDHR